MKILTLTLSPAFDVHCEVPNFRAEHENLVTASTRDVGGKGINIARALAAHGVENTPLVVVGTGNCADFLRGMDECGLTQRIVLRVAGRIRENITIHTSDAPETRISFKGFTTDKTLLADALDAISPDKETLVTFTGSLPQGISTAEAEEFLAALQRAGARIVIDSKSIPLDMLRRLKPWLIKPNEEELAAYFGTLDFEQTVTTAMQLHEGGIANALISLGERGAILACVEGVFCAEAPQVDVVSTIGAGDSMIAGFIAEQEQDAATRLRTAIASGSAACLTQGTNPPQASDIAKIAKKVTVKKIG